MQFSLKCTKILVYKLKTKRELRVRAGVEHVMRDKNSHTHTTILFFQII